MMISRNPPQATRQKNCDSTFRNPQSSGSEVGGVSNDEAIRQFRDNDAKWMFFENRGTVPQNGW